MSYLPVGGTTLSVKKLAADASYTSLGCITELTLDRGSRPSSIVGCITNATKEKIPGIPEPGQITFGILLNPSDTMHEWLAAELGQPPGSCVHSWQVGYPATADIAAYTDTVDGFVSAFEITESDVDGAIAANLTIDCTNLFTLAAVSGS